MIQWFQRLGLSVRVSAFFLIALSTALILHKIGYGPSAFGFILILIGLALNLVWIFFDRFVAVRRRVVRFTCGPDYLARLNEDSPFREPCVLGYFEQGTSRDQLYGRLSSRKWKAGASVNEHIFERGKWAMGFRLGLLLALFCVCLGATLSLAFREVHDFHLIEGQSSGSPLPFRITFARSERSGREQRFWLSWTKGAVQRDLGIIGGGTPPELDGQKIFLVRSGFLDRLGAFLLVQENGADFHTRLPPRSVGETLSLDKAEFQILEIEAEHPETGPSVKIRYQQEGKEAEEFWVFQNFKKTEQNAPRFFHFELQEVRPLAWIDGRSVRDPGYPFLFYGGICLLIFLALTFLTEQQIFWLVRNPDEIVLVGWSDRLSLFYPKFVRELYELRSLATPQTKSQAGEPEVWRGTL